MKKLLGWIVLLLASNNLWAQYPRTFANTNYGGMQSISFNPANIADSRYRFVANPLSFYLDVNNNFVNVRTPYSQWAALFNNLPDYYLDENGLPIYERAYTEQRLNGHRKQAYATSEVMGPSFMLGFKDKSGIGFSTKTRLFVSMNNLNEDLLKIFLEDSDTTYSGYTANAHQLKYKNKHNVQDHFGMGALAYQEFAVSYGKIFYEKEEHFIKAGASLKYNIGLGAAYLSASNLSYELINVDSLRFDAADMTAAYTSDRYFTDQDRRLYHYLGKEKLGKGMGIDIGFVYEYRPGYKDFKYRMDRKNFEDRTTNKYKFKIGGSINDFGRIKFNNSPYTQQLSISTDTLYTWDNFESVKKFNGTQDIDSFAGELFRTTQIDSSFKANLPTSLNLSLDYLIKPNWYASASYVQSLRGNRVRGVRKQNVFSTGIRYETRRFEAAANVVVGHFYNPVLVGAHVRVGPFYVGSDNLGGIFSPTTTNGFNIYTGFQLAILQNKPPDTDGDGVSDDEDQCPDEFGSDKAKGCPDEDGDRVPDDEDNCPFTPGTKKTHGCPDPDEDGLVGADDHCPDVFGEKETHGCPDTDGDGVGDDVDACLTVAGPVEYHGCPEPPEEKEIEKPIEKVEPKETPEIQEKPKPTIDPPKVEVPKSETPKVETPKVEKPAPTENITVHEVVDLMNFEEYDYYLILGAYKNKDLADNLVKKLNKEVGVLTYIYYDEQNGMNYVTFGRATDKTSAQNQLKILDRPDVNSRINGHVWWKKVPK
ncbi:MAG: SPOR domain-containing protein [Flavobacteriales bacterium]|nr:SPOR domain-containing protein [Flavobacteriales bacterium]